MNLTRATSQGDRSPSGHTHLEKVSGTFFTSTDRHPSRAAEKVPDTFSQARLATSSTGTTPVPSTAVSSMCIAPRARRAGSPGRPVERVLRGALGGERCCGRRPRPARIATIDRRGIDRTNVVTQCGTPPEIVELPGGIRNHGNARGIARNPARYSTGRQRLAGERLAQPLTILVAEWLMVNYILTIF